MAQNETVRLKSRVRAVVVVTAGTITGLAGVTNAGPAWAVAGHQHRRSAGSSPNWLALALFPGDWFGTSVAVSSTTTVVGAPAAPLLSSGFCRAYVFVRTATGWHESAELKSPETNGPDWFGDSVAVSGNTIVVGAPSHASKAVYVFVDSGNGWRATELKASDTVAKDDFGDTG